MKFVNMVSSSTALLTNPIMGAQPKYTEEDFEECRPEDEKMMELLIKNKVRVLTNKEVTVKYYLGGYSNDNGEPIEGTVEWEK